MQVFQIETFADGADCLSKSVTSGRRFGLQLLQIEMIGRDVYWQIGIAPKFPLAHPWLFGYYRTAVTES